MASRRPRYSSSFPAMLVTLATLAPHPGCTARFTSSSADNSAAEGGSGQGDDAGWADGTDFGGEVSAEPALLDFGVVDVGASSPAQSVRVTGRGTPISASPKVTGAGFAISGTTCPPVLAETCTVSVVFIPTTPGSASGSLTIGVATVVLVGVGNRSSGGPVSGDAAGFDLGTLAANVPAQVALPIGAQPWVTTCSAEGLTWR